MGFFNAVLAFGLEWKGRGGGGGVIWFPHPKIIPWQSTGIKENVQAMENGWSNSECAY